MSKNFVKFSKVGIKDNDSGRVIVDPIYDSLEVIPDKCIIFQRNQKKGIMSLDYKELTENVYDEILAYDKALICYKGDLAAVFNYSGKCILDLKYSYIHLDTNTIIATMNGKTGAFDYNGKVIAELKYKEVVEQDDYLLMTYNSNGKSIHEILNCKTGEKIIDLSAEYVLIEYYPHMMIFKKNEKYGVINLKTKNVVIQPKYDDIGINVNIKLLKVNLNGFYAVMDYDGNLKIPFRYTKINLLNERVEGIIDKNIEIYELPLKN